MFDVLETHHHQHRKDLTCIYLKPEKIRSSAPASDRSRYDLTLEVDRGINQSLDLPTIFFLDPSILEHGQVDIIRHVTPIPGNVLDLLGDMDEILATATRFFQYIHLWMPFVSKKRFYEVHLRPSYRSRPDVVLLLLSLKLLTTLPATSPRNPRTGLYNATKHFYLEIESSDSFSILILQAGILTALYELGHAVYPAAYLSLGACARYAHALGINFGSTTIANRVLTLVEVEERRRVWWAIVILDRFVSIGCPGRPFGTANPSLDDFLPADDAAWDRGIVIPDDVFTLSSPKTGHMSKFALLCQAARLLGQVQIHLSGFSKRKEDVWRQLDRTLQSMLAASLDVVAPDHDQISFVYSALVALHLPWLHPNGTSEIDKNRCQRARDVIQEISERISSNLLENQCFRGRNPEDMSPWGLFFGYQVCSTSIRSHQETSETKKLVQGLRETFLAIDVRWNAAGAYLLLLEAQEAMYNS